MTKAPKLTPTSFALLGLLARGPRSAYELNSIMQTNLIRVYWPRAESHVYSEPKKLLAHDLVTEQPERVNGRPRTVYTITKQGRTALDAWLQQETPAELRTQSEFMLKLLLANTGESANVQVNLENSLATSHAHLEEAIAGIEQILSAPGFAVEGMPWNGIAINLMADVLIARYRWSQYALQTNSALGSKSGSAKKKKLGLAAYQRALEKMSEALGEEEGQDGQ